MDIIYDFLRECGYFCGNVFLINVINKIIFNISKQNIISGFEETTKILVHGKSWNEVNYVKYLNME